MAKAALTRVRPCSMKWVTGLLRSVDARGVEVPGPMGPHVAFISWNAVASSTPNPLGRKAGKTGDPRTL